MAKERERQLTKLKPAARRLNTRDQWPTNFCKKLPLLSHETIFLQIYQRLRTVDVKARHPPTDRQGDKRVHRETMHSAQASHHAPRLHEEWSLIAPGQP